MTAVTFGQTRTVNLKDYALLEIQPVVIPTAYNALGAPVKYDTAVVLAMKGDDNLRNDTLGKVEFSYILLNRKGSAVRPIRLEVMKRGDYEAWDGENDSAHEWLAGKIGVTLK